VQPSKNSPDILLASLISPNENKPRLLLITGPRGTGKTLWCVGLAGRARARGLHLYGLVSPAIFEHGQKMGICLEDLETGQIRRLAYRKGELGGDIQMQDWQMESGTLEWGNSILKQIDTCDLFLLDEAGPLELEQNVGFSAGIHIVDTAKNFPCVVVVRPSLIDNALARWEWAQVLDLSTKVDL
jgi:nucleoside-triphosphatase THEP1